MAAEKLGRYMTSPQFIERANAAITKAVRELEAKGIQPAYVMRFASNGPAAQCEDGKPPETSPK